MTTRSVGLFGGSFNPPHVCHLLASLYLLETTDLAELWWLPVHRHAFDKDRTLACWDDRLALCEAVAADHPRIHINPVEKRLGSRSYTIQTVAALREEHPDCDFSWVIGSDLLPELPLWHQWEELREQVRFVVLGRGEQTDPATFPEGGRFVLRDFHLPDISSSQVRRALRAGEDIAPLVPAAVRRWLADHPEAYR